MIKMQSAVLGLIKENEGVIKYILMTDVNYTKLPQVSYGRMRICKYLGPNILFTNLNVLCGHMQDLLELLEYTASHLLRRSFKNKTEKSLFTF